MSIIPLTITAHVENQGDVHASAPQQFVGSKGQSRRLEGFTIQPPPVAGVEIEYMAHMESSGDTHWHKNGQFVGSRGQSRRLEGFAVRLVGHAAAHYDIKYYAHLANTGDSAVASNGEFVGSRGQSRRVEGMAVWMEPKAVPMGYPPAGAYPPGYPSYPPPSNYPPMPSYNPGYPPTHGYPPAPAYTPMPSYQPHFVTGAPVYGAPAPVQPPAVQVTVIPQGMGPITVYGQQFAGTKSQSRKLESLAMSVNYPGLDIEYMAHLECHGDSHWHRNGQPVGHAGSGLRIEGFAVRLSGPASAQFDVKYFGHLENQGDTAVASNGAFVGTRSQSKRCEGLQVWIEPKRY